MQTANALLCSQIMDKTMHFSLACSVLSNEPGHNISCNVVCAHGEDRSVCAFTKVDQSLLSV